ncbi:MAG: UDP-N-acetylmuramate dehydrogenase [Bacteroidota bacterium]
MAPLFISDYPLKALNTFGMDVVASKYAAFDNPDRLLALLEAHKQNPSQLLILGGGSNILFTRDFDGLVLKSEIQGIEVVDDNGSEVLVKVGSGVVWHRLVEWCIDHGFGGIENLSLIPGTTGAAPIQNIGAYGVELKDVFHSLECIHIDSGTYAVFQSADCMFGYRDSIFKRSLKGKVVIVSVTLKLTRNRQVNVSYGAITQELQKMGVHAPGIREVSEAVCAIRRSKLPDPAVIGNAGSFFKNPEVSEATYEELKKDHPALIAYPFGAHTYKLAAGWLIEQCGWKGKVVGHTGAHKDQALVLVNYGGASGEEVLRLSEDIRASVRSGFGVEIEPEVNII